MLICITDSDGSRYALSIARSGRVLSTTSNRDRATDYKTPDYWKCRHHYYSQAEKLKEAVSMAAADTTTRFRPTPSVAEITAA